MENPTQSDHFSINQIGEKKRRRSLTPMNKKTQLAAVFRVSIWIVLSCVASYCVFSLTDTQRPGQDGAGD